jgi:hypothetical protein
MADNNRRAQEQAEAAGQRAEEQSRQQQSG